MKCAVEAPCNLNAGEFTLPASGDDIKMARGYPRGGDANGISHALAYTGFTAMHTPGRTLFAKHGANDAQTCAVIYQAPTADGQAPTITALTAGC
jgi:hypothetical protein